MSEQTIDITDARVLHISDEVGLSPVEILTDAEQLAAQNGDTVSDELDTGVEVADMLVGLDGVTFEDDDDSEEDDDLDPDGDE